MLPLQMLYFEDLSVGMTETLSKTIDASPTWSVLPK